MTAKDIRIGTAIAASQYPLNPIGFRAHVIVDFRDYPTQSSLIQDPIQAIDFAFPFLSEIPNWQSPPIGINDALCLVLAPIIGNDNFDWKTNAIRRQQAVQRNL